MQNRVTAEVQKIRRNPVMSLKSAGIPGLDPHLCERHSLGSGVRCFKSDLLLPCSIVPNSSHLHDNGTEPFRDDAEKRTSFKLRWARR